MTRLFEQFNYIDYKNLFDRYWDYFIFKNRITKEDFLDHLHYKIRIERITIAHVKALENDLLSLNESLFILRMAINSLS